MVNIEDLRKEIDVIDYQISSLIQRRMDLSKDVASYKKDKNVSLYNKIREDIVLNNVKKNIRFDDKFYIEILYKVIMDISKRKQLNLDLDEDVEIDYEVKFKVLKQDLFRFVLQISLFNVSIKKMNIKSKDDFYICEVFLLKDTNQSNIKKFIKVLSSIFYFDE